MIKFTYKDNNIYLGDYLIKENIKPDNYFEEIKLSASISENNHYLNKWFKGYKIENLKFKKDENLYYIDVYNKKYNIKRIEKFCIWFYEYNIGLSI